MIMKMIKNMKKIQWVSVMQIIFLKNNSKKAKNQ